MLRRRIAISCIVALLAISAYLGLNRSAAANANHRLQIPILMYHHFVETEAEIFDPTMVVTKERFAEQLQWFDDQQFTTITMADLEAFLYEGAPLPTKPLLITIDDGYRSNYELAFPVLQGLGMKATIFTLAKYQDQPKPPTNLPSFSWAQAKEMVDSGLIDLQSHTYGLHQLTKEQVPTLVAASDAEVRQDFAAAKAAFERELGYAPRYIAFPYGRYTEREATLAQEAGLRLGVSVDKGCNTRETDPWRLKRINVTQQLTVDELGRRFAPKASWWQRLLGRQPQMSC